MHVVFALMTREMKTRFGKYKLGYLWAVLEPLGYVGAFSLIRLAFGSEPIGGLAFPVFFAMGILPFMIFNSSVMQSLLTVEANQGLFIYRRIRPYHCVLSRILLEFLSYGLALILILLLFAGFKMDFSIGSWWWTLLLTFFFFGFCVGLGLAMAVIGPQFIESEKFVPIFIRPLFLLSGVFIPLSAIPEEYMAWVLPNPLLHFIELYRYTLFQGYASSLQSLFYVWLTSTLVFALGILLYYQFERKILTSGTIKLR